MSTNKPFSQACENNWQPILDVLQRHFGSLNTGGKVLEVGSGTGQHAVRFAGSFPKLYWQTSDLLANHAGINAWVADSGLDNLGRPLLLDVLSPSWSMPHADQFQAVFSANTCHIMPWQAVEKFIPGVADVLGGGGVFCLYGPFNYNGQYTSQSNTRFDIWLKQQAPHQAIRDFEAVNQLADQAGLTLLEDNAMPANNRLLVWKKDWQKV